MPPQILTIIELSLRIILEAMEGQTPEQKAKLTQWWIEFVEFLRKPFNLPT